MDDGRFSHAGKILCSLGIACCRALTQVRHAAFNVTAAIKAWAKCSSTSGSEGASSQALR
jgi:hypothetical protein